VKIYTKTGDAGETGLFGGGRVGKDHPRVAAYGAVDELNAALGLAASLEPRAFERELLETVQRDLFTIGAELASPDPAKLAKSLPGPRLGDAAVEALEDAIDRTEAALPPLKQFILPGGTSKAAALQLARAVCRRAERAAVTLSRDAAVSPAILKYLNRLSDLLFVLGRAANAVAGLSDVPW
jgi:cob(I)alamin adenosyltransferase